ncbi:RNA polymerase sigma factor [Draconibacterium halophilum]|uniref:Sigma-70 family RNA polymerase sigma factor n=1 Tax=Draconibacterium halophilum TaxID=2706887 RepID=A0A6C0RH44_9BACT|nr:sigma-70 family RNA polymerase sigma factor [Draconibacterium halophilum]QIA09844.1 sigma-70 family RNA polymerase sigma factor [Draconibacterium halophilum]
MTTEEFKNMVIPYSVKLYPMLFRILKNEEETRDALQELMLRLWNRKEELVKCRNQSAYIVTMARNYSFDLLKKKRPETMDEKQEYRILNLEAGGTNSDTIERYENVRQVINDLPEKYQTVIQLRDVDGFSFDEIKEITGYEVANLRVILSRARQKVKQEIEKIYDYDTSGKYARQIL